MRGLSLAELLIAMTISFLLLSILFGVFTLGGRWFRWSTARTDVGAATILGLNGLSRELRNSAWSTITISSSTSPGPAICFAIEDPTMPMYPGPFTPAPYMVVYYLDAPHQALVRKTWGGPGTSPSPALPPAGTRAKTSDLQAMLATVNGTEHAVAGGVLRFGLDPPDFPATAPVSGIGISLQLQQPVDSSQTVGNGLQTRVYPRNPAPAPSS